MSDKKIVSFMKMCQKHNEDLNCQQKYMCIRKLRKSLNMDFNALAYAHMPFRSKRLRVTLRIKPNSEHIAITKPQQNPFFIGQCSWHGTERNNFPLINIMRISLHRSHRSIIVLILIHSNWKLSFCIDKIQQDRTTTATTTPSISLAVVWYLSCSLGHWKRRQVK